MDTFLQSFQKHATKVKVPKAEPTMWGDFKRSVWKPLSGFTRKNPFAAAGLIGGTALGTLGLRKLIND